MSRRLGEHASTRATLRVRPRLDSYMVQLAIDTTLEPIEGGVIGPLL